MMRLWQQQRPETPAPPGSEEKVPWESGVLEFWERWRGRILGTAIGLLIGYLVIRIGWWAAVTLAIFLYIGYAIGNSFDNE